MDPLINIAKHIDIFFFLMFFFKVFMVAIMLGRPFFSTFLHQSQFKYANILYSEHKSCFGNVRILLLPVKLELIHHLGTIEPWHELTKQSRLNLLSTCVIDRASIFANHNNNKNSNEEVCLSSKTDKNMKTITKQKFFDTKAEQWRT